MNGPRWDLFTHRELPGVEIWVRTNPDGAYEVRVVGLHGAPLPETLRNFLIKLDAADPDTRVIFTEERVR